jgi:hypothetical protein
MILLYSIFACSVMLGGVIVAISIIRGGYTDTSSISAFQYTPEEHP